MSELFYQIKLLCIEGSKQIVPIEAHIMLLLFSIEISELYKKIISVMLF